MIQIKVKWRYFRATNAKSRKMIAGISDKRRNAALAVTNIVYDAIQALAEHVGARPADLVATTRVQFTLDPATRARIATFRVSGKFPKNAIAGWTNRATRAETSIAAFDPDPKTIKRMADVPPWPSDADLANLFAWKLYFQSGVHLQPPAIWIADDECGFAVPAEPSLPGMGNSDAAIRKRLADWQPPAGFKAISRAEYDLYIATANAAAEKRAKRKTA
ncbi:MAG: hypothetical protein IBJ15_00910 [Alphaproteobacteria bacterium]|nr:hypothetical protein [Alphaproteobacteria bacterium]